MMQFDHIFQASYRQRAIYTVRTRNFDTEVTNAVEESYYVFLLKDQPAILSCGHRKALRVHQCEPSFLDVSRDWLGKIF